jgi:hypothetical protein
MGNVAHQQAEMDGAPPERELPVRVGPLSRDQYGDEGHDQILDQRIDEAVECASDDDPDRKFDDISLEGERLELVEEGPNFVSSVAQCGLGVGQHL